MIILHRDGTGKEQLARTANDFSVSNGRHTSPLHLQHLNLTICIENQYIFDRFLLFEINLGAPIGCSIQFLWKLYSVFQSPELRNQSTLDSPFFPHTYEYAFCSYNVFQFIQRVRGNACYCWRRDWSALLDMQNEHNTSMFIHPSYCEHFNFEVM